MSNNEKTWKSIFKKTYYLLIFYFLTLNVQKRKLMKKNVILLKVFIYL